MVLEAEYTLAAIKFGGMKGNFQVRHKFRNTVK